MKEYKGFLVDDNFNFYNARTKRKITPFIGRDGYLQVSRTRADHSMFHARVHVILANLFIPNPNGYKYVNHIDSNKLNNALNNLEWCTNSYNVKHGWHSGNRTHKNRTKVKAINKLTKIEYCFNSIRELSAQLHLDRHKVARILKNELTNAYPYDFYYI